MKERSVKPYAPMGYGLTVFKSPVIQQFPLEIIGKYPGGGTAGQDLILARLKGAVIDKIGGLPFGASGSPVFINSKNIGAISTVIGGDSKLVGITPIQAMLSVKDEYGRDGGLTAGKHSQAVAVGFKSAGALKELKRHIGPEIVAISSNPEGARRREGVRSGSPIGVGLMVGDLKVGFIGTATLLEGGELYAFGHPILFAGPVRMPLTSAVIYATARGSFPQKIGDIGAVIGTVYQDRSAGIYGRLGVMPTDLVSARLIVTDLNRKKVERIRIQMVPMPGNVPYLAFSAVYETFVRAMDRIGQGTAGWQLTVHSEGESEPFVSYDKKYDSADISYVVANTVATLLNDLYQKGEAITSFDLVASVEMGKTV